MSDKKEIIIIGSGIAGLSAGIYALRNGYDATIIESHDKTGGQLTAWMRECYTFDYCLQWLVGTRRGASNELWREIGAIQPANTEVIDHDIFHKVVDDERGEFILYRDAGRWEAYMKDLAPEDSGGIRRLCGMVRRADDFVDAWTFQSPPECRSYWDYCRAVVRSATFLPVFVRYRKSTCRELIEDLGLKNEKLRSFLGNMFGEADFPALGLIAVMGFQHAKNAGYLKGGSRRMARLVTDTYKSLGGELRLDTRVKEIIVERDTAKGVKLESGEEVLSDYVISACDGHTVLYEMLGGRYIPPATKQAYENWRLFDPLVMVSFGIDETVVSECHNTTYAKREKIDIGRTKVREYCITNRSMYDETFTPRGKTALLFYFDSPWTLWEDLTNEREYAKEKRAIEEKSTRLLEEKYPGISEHIETVDVATPRTEVRYTGVWKGAHEGFFPRMDASNDGLPMELDRLKNFWMIGQWLFPGGGLPPSAQSGRWVIQKLCKEDGRRFRHRAEEGCGDEPKENSWNESTLKVVCTILMTVLIVDYVVWSKVAAWGNVGGPA